MTNQHAKSSKNALLIGAMQTNSDLYVHYACVGQIFGTLSITPIKTKKKCLIFEGIILI